MALRLSRARSALARRVSTRIEARYVKPPPNATARSVLAQSGINRAYGVLRTRKKVPRRSGAYDRGVVVSSAIHTFFFWGGWSALVAIGTLALAGATGWLGLQSKRGVDDAWAREWAAQRPIVYPHPLRDWAYASEGSPYRLGNQKVLPIKNGGRGPALDVRGEVHTRDPRDNVAYSRTIIAGTIAPGDLFDSRIVPQPGIQHWLGAVGVLRYHDLVGNEWQTRFRVVEAPGNEMAFETEIADTASIGEPVLPPAEWASWADSV